MMWLEKIFVSTSAILRDYMIGLAFDAGKGSIEKRCSDRQLRKKLKLYIESQNRFNETCTLAEEIDYQGILDYVKVSLMEDVDVCIFGKLDERKKAIENLQNKAIVYAKADNLVAEQRVCRFIENVFDIIYASYRECINHELLMITAEITDEVHALKKDIRIVKDEIIASIETREKTKTDAVFHRLEAQLHQRKSTGGCFYQLSVDKTLIPNINTENSGRFENTQITVDPLYECLRLGWNDEGKTKQILLLADGGMGKSTAILHTWEQLISEQIAAIYIPLQEILDGTGNLEQEISKQFGCSLEKACEQFERIVLFLDGFNEMKANCVRDVVASLKKLCMVQEIQMVVSSRYDFRPVYGMKFLEGAALEQLTETQVEASFTAEQLMEIKVQPYLYELLHNPMMLMLYRKVESVQRLNKEVPWIEWKSQISASGDLLWNYYQAQCVSVLLDREIDGLEIVKRVFALNHLLPVIGYDAMISERLEITENELENSLERAMRQYEKQWGIKRPPAIKAICRSMDVDFDFHEISIDECISLLSKRLHFLSDNKRTFAFLHQIHRDYMASLYLFSLFSCNDNVPEEWKERSYDETVYHYLRSLTKNEWASDGVACRILNSKRGEASLDYTIANTLNCWLSKSCESAVVRDLTKLDLREYQLSKHLMKHYQGQIDISGSMVTEYTFIDNVKHDRLLEVVFSNNSRYIAALSANGILSLYDRENMTHRILKQVEISDEIDMYFSLQDHLVLRGKEKAFCWNTELYDRVKKISIMEEVQADVSVGKEVDIPEDAKRLYSLLEQNYQLGTCHSFSPDYLWMVTGNKDGLIEIWECDTQNLVSSIRLGNNMAISAAFSTNGKLCVVTSGGRLLQVWDMEEMLYKTVIYMPSNVRDMKFKDQENPYLVSCILTNGTEVDVDCKKEEHILINKNSVRQPLNIAEIEKRLGSIGIGKIDTSRFGNAIVLSKDGKKVFVWHHKIQKWTQCASVTGELTDVAICKSDDRFAAGYSNHRVSANEVSYYKGARRARAKKLINQKVIRIWHTDTGQLIIRLPTQNKSIRALKFFTNGIIIAGFATDGSILLWKLKNKRMKGREIGKWDDEPTIIQNNSEIPLECVITSDNELICAYADGAIIRRNQAGTVVNELYTLPGIDLMSVKMDNLSTDGRVDLYLAAYQKMC